MKLVRDSYAWMKNPFAFLDSCGHKGLTFRQRFLVPGKCLLTGDHELIDQIRIHPALAAGKSIQGLRRILGDDSLIMLHGEAHRQRRDIIAPYFRGESLSRLDQRIREISREEFARAHGIFSAFAVFQKISLRTILLHLLGDLSAAEEERAMRIVIAFLGSFTNPLVLFSRALQVNLGRYSAWGRALANRAVLLKYLDEVLEKRPESTAGRIAEAMQSQGATHAAVKNEIMALLLFGHDTGAAVLSWAAAHVCGNSEASERLHGKAETPGSMLLRAENYLHACILETMRISPSVVHVTRRTDSPVTIGEWVLEPDTAIMPCMYLAHRDARIFDRPDEFRPERFLDTSYPSSSFFPFGLSDRLCVGMPFVLRQMQLTLGAMAQFRFKLAPGYTPAPERKLVIIIPAGGCMLERQT